MYITKSCGQWNTMLACEYHLTVPPKRHSPCVRAVFGDASNSTFIERTHDSASVSRGRCSAVPRGLSLMLTRVCGNNIPQTCTVSSDRVARLESAVLGSPLLDSKRFMLHHQHTDVTPPGQRFNYFPTEMYVGWWTSFRIRKSINVSGASER